MTKKNKSKNNKTNYPGIEDGDKFEFILNPGESHIDKDIDLTGVIAIGFWCKVISKGNILINIDDISIFNKNLDVCDWKYIKCDIDENDFDKNIKSVNLKFESRDSGVILVNQFNYLYPIPKDFENKTTNKTIEEKPNDDRLNKYKPLKTDFTEPTTVNISNVEPTTVNKINSFINLINEDNTGEHKFDRRKYILSLIEDDLKGLTLDNTFIKLDKEYTFNRNELHENNKAIATTKPILDKEDAIIITEVPNNLDKFNSEQRSYCYGDKSSVHAGYYIFNDIHYYFIYDSDEEIIEVKIVNPANMKYYVHDEELKEKLLNDNSFIMDSLEKKLSIRQLFETSSKPIMYRYTNWFEINKIDYGKPINVGLIFNYHFEL